MRTVSALVFGTDRSIPSSEGNGIERRPANFRVAIGAHGVRTRARPELGSISDAIAVGVAAVGIALPLVFRGVLQTVAVTIQVARGATHR